MRRHDFRWNPLLLAAVLFSLTACAATPFSQLTQPRTSMETQVFLKPAFISHQPAKLLIHQFTHPHYAPGTGRIVTQEFYQELLRSGLYRQITLSSQVSGESKDSPISTELKDYDLAMRGRISHVLAGSGNTPSQLTVEIQIMTAYTGTLVWFVRLDAASETGADIDLIWHTYEGQGTLPYQVLARGLAQRLVKVMTPPPEPETPTAPVKSPLSKEPVDSEG